MCGWQDDSTVEHNKRIKQIELSSYPGFEFFGFSRLRNSELLLNDRLLVGVVLSRTRIIFTCKMV
jgi:hypothetical protein